MSFTFKDRIGLTIFGSSHGEAVGVVLDGIPSGFKIDKEDINKWLKRRAPGKSSLTSQRKESDECEIISGLKDNFTDGGSITIVIKNQDQIGRHYDEIKNNPRPGHGDLSLYMKYGPFRNYYGGGFLSGRMTAPLVAAGSISAQILLTLGIRISSYIDSMGDIELRDHSFRGEEEVYSRESRIPDENANLRAIELIKKLQAEGDSVGASIRTVIQSVPRAIGEPFFDSVESIISHLMFSIPGVKGIEFGSGFDLTKMKGSKSNEAFVLTEGVINTATNHNGGILGGITYGDPIDFRIAMKPTSSIRGEQKTINVETMVPSTISVVGRHDPCIAIRAVPVVQCLTAFAILDLYLRRQSSYKGNFENDASYGKYEGNHESE